MPRCDADTPRQMFPPPMTTDTCTPRSRTSFIRSAISRTTVGEMLSRPPRSCTASPLSFRTMRLYAGFSVCMNDFHDQQKISILESTNTRVIRATRSTHFASLRVIRHGVHAEIPPCSCVAFLPVALRQAIARLRQRQLQVLFHSAKFPTAFREERQQWQKRFSDCAHRIP